jgi:hypothetical protein
MKQATANLRAPSAAHGRHGALTTPLRYLSSADAGWEGLDAEAFVEPQELEGWLTPVLPAVSLVFFRGGAYTSKRATPTARGRAPACMQAAPP